MKKTIRLVILDLDDTQFGALPRFEKCLSPLMTEMASSRGIKLGTIEDMIREANGQHRFNDGAALIEAMVGNNTILHTPHLTEEWKRADKTAQTNWIQRSHDLTVFFPGVLESLKFWKDKGVSMVIQTDCEDIAAIRNLWMLGQNAYAHGHLKSPTDVLDFYDAVYCQPGIEPSDVLRQSIPNDFYELAKAKLKIWGDRLYKPTATHILKILSDAHVKADEALYIGDSHKDGAEAKSIDPPAQFAWSRYGTRVDRKTLDFCFQVASKSYAYGEEAITREMLERGIQPDIIIDGQMSDILSVYEWLPAIDKSQIIDCGAKPANSQHSGYVRQVS